MCYTPSHVAPSPIFLHENNNGHETILDNFRIIGREDNNLARTIKESMYIRVNNPTLKGILENTISLTSGIKFYSPFQS